MTRKNNQNFLQGAAILAVSVVIVKILGAIYKVPLANILGDEGYAHFSLAYAIYNFLLTLSTAGLPVALSRMIAASNAQANPAQVKRNFNVARLSFFTLGGIASLIMALFARQLASSMGNPDAAPSVFALAPSVVLVCLMSAYRGYTQGLSDMIPTSVSQIIEVICKLVFGLALAWWFLNTGRGLPMASAGAIIGVTAGSLLGLLYCIFYKRRADYTLLSHSSVPAAPLSWYDTFKKLVSIGIPVTIGSSILSVLSIIDTTLVLNRLQEAAGYTSEQAVVLYGAFSKVQTLFNLPSAFIVPVSVSVIPAISAYLARKNFREAGKVTEASIKLTSLLALPAGIGLSILAVPIVHLIFPDTHSEAPILLAILGFASFFVCLALITTAILQAYGFERFPVYTMAIGGIMKIAVTWVLVSNPDIGVRGAAYSSVACYLLISLINIIFIRSRLPEQPSIFKTLTKPLIATLFMGAAAFFAYQILDRLLSAILSGDSRLSLILPLLGSILTAIITYLIFIVLLRAITKDDLAMIPKGQKLAKILRLK